jgi:low affinity Fe/Cu permease
MNKNSNINEAFEKFSNAVTKTSGKPFASLLAFLVVILWLISGPIFNYSNVWQLMINTGTTIITFLMVFIIQMSQNKDTMAVQLKLNELIASHKKASNRLVVIEDLSSEELEVLKKFYVRLSALSKEENQLHTSHSLDEAETIHKKKKRRKLPNSNSANP